MPSRPLPRVIAILSGVVLGVVLSVLPDLGTCVSCTADDIAVWEQRSFLIKSVIGLVLLTAAVILRRRDRPALAVAASAGGIVLLLLLFLGTAIRAAERSVA